MLKRTHTCIYALEKSILGMLGLPFPAVARVEVLRQELHFLLQHLLHRPIRNALRIHQHGLPHLLGVQVGLVAALPGQRLVLVRERRRYLCIIVAI